MTASYKRLNRALPGAVSSHSPYIRLLSLARPKMLSSLLLLVTPFLLFSATSALPQSAGLASRGDVRPQCRGADVVAATAAEPPAPAPTTNQPSIVPVNGSAPFANATSKPPSSGYHSALYFTNWFVLAESRRSPVRVPLTSPGASMAPTFNLSRSRRTRSPTFSMPLLTLPLVGRCKYRGA